LFLLILFIFLNSCSPVNYSSLENLESVSENTESVEVINNKKIVVMENKKIKEKNKKTKPKLYISPPLLKEVSIILPINKKYEISKQFVNVIELATYEKQLQNTSFTIDLYNDSNDLQKIIQEKISPGKIFIGPLDSKETVFLNQYCKQGVMFFSFASKKDLAKECVFLINFFPENELKTLFKNFPSGSKIALLYPENTYGYMINLLIDDIANQSDSVIINRASYNEDLTNVREAIKELGKYELRKYDLNRQKQILATKKDEQSKERLKRLKKFQTTKDLDFTHILLPDYGLRLLQVAPLLPYYDVDPDVVQFVGTGVWDDPVFFSEPSLQNAIFPGVQINKRENLIKDYNNMYGSKLMRTSTLAYDMIGLLSYMYKQDMSLNNVYELLNNHNIKFDGIDGSFYFKNNVIERNLDIVQISKGKTLKIN